MSQGTDSFVDVSDELPLPGQWYAVDIHVHSPFSYDFEGPFGTQGSARDHGLIWILEQAYKANVQVIAITDHNSMAGYQRLRDLGDELDCTGRTLERTGIPTPPDVERQIKLFQQVMVLPGVELDIDPNIHLLVLFNPQTAMNDIDHFIDEAGFPVEVRDDKTACRHARWTIEVACREASALGAIPIAAHVDGDKGLYEASREWGQKRIAAFTDANLCAMEFRSPISRDQIQSLLRQPDYLRTSPLAFVQSSDFHGTKGQRLGERLTWVRMDDVRWEAHHVFKALRDALSNPDEYVSAPGRPQYREIERRLEGRPAVAGLDEQSDVSRLCQFVCAYANTESGTVVVGRNDRGNLVGVIGQDRAHVRRRIEGIIHSGVKPTPWCSIDVYPYYQDKFWAAIRVTGQPAVSVADDNMVYVLEQGKPRPASTSEVIQLAEDRLLRRYSRLSISPRLAGVADRLRGMRDSIDILPLVRKIERQTSTMPRHFSKPRPAGRLTAGVQAALHGCEGNGVAKGDVVVLTERSGPRLPDRYVRLTAPLALCSETGNAIAQLPAYAGCFLLVSLGGAVYLHTGGPVAVCSRDSATVSELRDPENSPDIRFLAAYLKCAVAIWYADRCLGSVDISDPYVLLRVRIPDHAPVDLGRRVADLVDELATMEHTYLEMESSALASVKDSERDDAWKQKLRRATDEHNAASARLLANIDQLFFEMLGLTEDEVLIVQDGLRGLNLMAFDT